VSVSYGTPELFTAALGGSSGNVSVSPPSGLQAGDGWLLLCFVDTDNVVTISASGFTATDSVLQNTYFNVGYPCYRGLYKVAGAGESSVNVAFGSASYAAQVVSIRLTGSHGTTPVGNVVSVVNDTQNAVSPSYAPPSLTVQDDGSLAIFLALYHAQGGFANTVNAVPSGMTQIAARVSPHGGTYPQWVVCAGAANAGTFAPSGSISLTNTGAAYDKNGVTQIIEIRPGAAPAAPQGSTYQARRRRPGRSPYSTGRYFRTRAQHYGAPASGGSFTLIVSDALHAHVADNATLSQASTLTLADVLHAHAADQLGLTQAHVLAVAETLHVHSPDAPTLSQASTLALADALHAHAADGMALTQAHILAIADSLHGHGAESPSLSTGLTLSVAEALHGHSADALALIQAYVLSVADALHAQAVDGVTLVTGLSLALTDATHAHVADAPVLTQANTLAVQEATHGQAAEAPALTQAHVLIVQETTHGHVADHITLSQSIILAVAEALHGHAADPVSIVQAFVLLVQDSGHGHVTDSPALTQAGILLMSDALHAHLADQLFLQMPGMGTAPPQRMIAVRVRGRTVLVSRATTTKRVY
jgi:hypothetical protein